MLTDLARAFLEVLLSLEKASVTTAAVRRHWE
jgi:hypothetical protein